MVPYRALAPQHRKQKSPRADARERARADIEALLRSKAKTLPLSPTKLQQLEALAKQGCVANPVTENAEANGVSLTDRVRALYENSVVPVREIAQLAGVTERTLYKYVQRGGWQRRHARGFHPAKGAGGRFVSLEDAQQPQPHGLKALDPLAAAQASAQIEQAQQSSDTAVAQALADAEREEQVQTDLRTLKYVLETIQHCKAILKMEKARKAAEKLRDLKFSAQGQIRH